MTTNTKKRRIIDGSTLIDQSFLQGIFGGDTTADPSSPNFAGHLHDDGNEWGHAGKIDLSNHVTGRLLLDDESAVVKTLTLSVSSGIPLGRGVIWYFSIPPDLDITKPAYFSFSWMGDSTDGIGNIVNTMFQSTVFKITWQWYVPGYAIFAPSTIFDSLPPANQTGSNINANTLSRGRLPNFTVNTAPFQLLINDSASKPNYVKLTGLEQAQNAAIVGVQIDVTSTGFPNGIAFVNGSLIYLSRTLGGSNTNVSSL